MPLRWYTLLFIALWTIILVRMEGVFIHYCRVEGIPNSIDYGLILNNLETYHANGTCGSGTVDGRCPPDVVVQLEQQAARFWFDVAIASLPLIGFMVGVSTIWLCISPLSTYRNAGRSEAV